MLIVETIAKIRRMYYVNGEGVKTIARKLNISKNTVKKVLKGNQTKFNYERSKETYRVLENFKSILITRLKFDKNEPKRRRRTAKKLFEEIQAEGYTGSYGAVNNFVQKWKKDNKLAQATAFIPLIFDPGESFQFDWSTEEISLKGELTKVKAAQIRLCYSRFFLTVVYPNEQLEMVMDAHDKAFKFFQGCCKKGIYDNMKTAIQKILIGKDRKINERFQEMASHYLFEVVACTPAASWEKGQVENQVDTSRCNFFTPLVKVENLEELNLLLKEKCLDWAKKTKHPELQRQTVWEVYQQEKEHLLPYRYPFDACKIQAGVVSSCCLINYDANSYSVECNYAHKAVELKIYAKTIIITKEGKIIGQHKRSFERHKRIYNPWHYVPLLEKKPGALRNGAPFREFNFPKAIKETQLKLLKISGGDKEFVKILLKLQEYGIEKVAQACDEVLAQGICNADLIISKLETKLQTEVAQKLILNCAPNNDCNCYNKLLLKQE